MTLPGRNAPGWKTASRRLVQAMAALGLMSALSGCIIAERPDHRPGYVAERPDWHHAPWQDDHHDGWHGDEGWNHDH